MDNLSCCARTNNVNHNNKYYLLLKVNKNGRFHERRVYIKNILNKGTHVIVQSGNGSEKDKNKILLYLIVGFSTAYYLHRRDR